jgi:tetratricopeptide (TPR) repeat protein
MDSGPGKLLQEAVRTLSTVGDWPMIARASKFLGVAKAKLQDLAAARAAFIHSIDIYQELGLMKDQAECLSNWADILQLKRDPECIRLYKEARSLYLKLGMKLPAAQILNWEGVARLVCGIGSHEERQQIFERARLELSEAGDLDGVSWVCYNEASALLALGDIAGAIQASEVVHNGFRGLGNK